MRGGILAAAAAFFVFPLTASAQSPARTGEAERAGGPLRVVSESTAAVFMVAGTRPTARPAKPVDAWFWTFHRAEQSAGSHRYDILVTRERMDCAAGTAQILGVEAYRDGSLVVADKAGRPARPQQPGTTGHAKLNSVCDPGFRSDAPSYADHRVARAAVPMGSVASAPKPALPKAVPPPPAAAKAPAPAGPAGVATAEKAATTGEAERAGGPLRQFRISPAFTMMTAGPAPKSRPNAPVEIWRWTFFELVVGEGERRHDASAVRLRVNCATNVVQPIVREHYRNGTLVYSEPSRMKPYTPQAGTGEHDGFRSVCEPGFKADAPTFPHHHAARAAIPLGSALPGIAAKPPAPSGPTPVTAAAKAPATGEAERARGELRVIGFTAELVTMVAGPRPTKDTRTAEIWLWTFLPAERRGGGKPYDASASRLRIDCAAGTTNAWGQLENYRNGELVQSLKSSGWPPRKEPPGSLGHLAIRASCEPDFASKLTALPDHRAAREASWKHFAQQGKASRTAAAKAPAQTAPTTSQAQKAAKISEAESAGLPLRWVEGQVDSDGGFVTMVAGPVPSRRPTEPVDAWFWTLFSEPISMGPLTFDTDAKRVVVDCAAGTVANRGMDSFLNDRLVNESYRGSKPAPAQKPTPGSAQLTQIRAVCEPGFAAKGQTFADHRAARAAALKYFAQQGAVTPAAKASAPSGPTPVTADEKTAKPAEAGQGNLPRSPLRMAASSREEGVVVMVSGPAPKARPTAPVRVLAWNFYRDEQKAGKYVYDTLTQILIVDCTASTTRVTLFTAYRDGRLVATLPPPAGTEVATVKPGTIAHSRLRGVCEPGYRANEPNYPDHVAARASALKFFAQQGATAPAAKASAPSGPTPVTAGEKAAAKIGKAEQAGGPLRLVSTPEDFVAMTTAPVPKSRPAKPVEFWDWRFLRAPRTEAGTRFDGMAYRWRANCAAGTIERLAFELYRDGKLVYTDARRGDPIKAEKGKLAYYTLHAACDPGFNPKATTFSNHHTARAAVAKHFANQKK